MWSFCLIVSHLLINQQALIQILKCCRIHICRFWLLKFCFLSMGKSHIQQDISLHESYFFISFTVLDSAVYWLGMIWDLETKVVIIILSQFSNWNFNARTYFVTFLSCVNRVTPSSCLSSGLWMGSRQKTKVGRLRSLIFPPLQLRVSYPALIQLPQVNTHTHTLTLSYLYHSFIIHIIYKSIMYSINYQSAVEVLTCMYMCMCVYMYFYICPQGPMMRATPCRLSLS